MSKKQKIRKSRWDFKDDEYDEEVDILDSRLKEPLKEFPHSRRGDVDPIMASNQRSRRSPVEMDIIKHHQMGMENMAKKGHVYPSIGASPKKHGFNRVSRSNKRNLDHVLHRTGYLDDGAANLTNKDYLNWDANWNYKVLHQQGKPDTAAKRLEKSKATAKEHEKTRRKVVFKKKSGGKKKSKYNKRMARKNKRKTRRKKGAKAYGKHRPYVDACKRRYFGTNCTKGFKCQAPPPDYKISPEAAEEHKWPQPKDKIDHMYPTGFLDPEIPLRYHDIYLNGDLKWRSGEKCERGSTCYNRCIPEKDAKYFYHTGAIGEAVGIAGKGILGEYASLPGKAFAAIGNAAGRGLKSFDKTSRRLMKKKEPDEYDRIMDKIDAEEAEERQRKRERNRESGRGMVSNAAEAYAGYELGRRVGLIDGDPLQDGIDYGKEKVRDGVRSMVAGKKYTKKKRKKKRVKSNKYFKKHYMWNTRGKRYMAKTYKQHVRGMKSGHTHKKPRKSRRRRRK